MMTLFPLGRVVATPGAMEVIEALDEFPCVHRHARGEWGDLDAHDCRVNEDAPTVGARILSHYKTPAGRIYVITEADRTLTTVLLPEEY